MKQSLDIVSQFFSSRSENQDGLSATDWLRHFAFISESAERNSKKLDRKQDLMVLSLDFFFRSEIKIAYRVSDWQRQILQLLLNR